MAGFMPSANGLRFTNSFPHEAAVKVDLGPAGVLAVGDASNGLCGGMVFAVCDYLAAHEEVPDLTAPPAEGSPLFTFLVRRLVDSWDVPGGVLKYVRWMATPDGDVGVSPFVVRGVTWMTLHSEWPHIKDDLDAGRLCPIGLVTVAGVNVKALGNNHQVLAYGYELDADRLTLHVYDPNTRHDQADGVQISLSTATPTHGTPIQHNVNIKHPIRGFFRTGYTPADPPAA